MTAISLRNLAKCFGSTTAVDGVDLDVAAGELFFLLGPSGCGKTTLLRMLAGFVEPTDGSIHFGDRDVTYLPPNKRNTGMVFQSYALWPHMSVVENVAYGLGLRGLDATERAAKATGALAAVQMEHLASRRPNQLSGGQQQRVALARAIVVEPDLLLLDEPLSNLDAKLRLEMRMEIRRICTTLGITTVYVTHDQKEALSIADRMAVLRDGRIEQVGTPREVYDRPVSRFVAEFIGETNFVPAIGNGATLASALGALKASEAADGPVTCSIRPEAIEVRSRPAKSNGFQARRIETIYLGEVAQHRVAVGDDLELRIIEVNPKASHADEGDLYLSVAPDDIVVLRD